MARVTIIAEDSAVYVDRVARQVDLTELDPDLHAVQWDGRQGWIEFKDARPNVPITTIAPYQIFIDRWTAAAPPPPPPPIPDPREPARNALRAKPDTAVVTTGDLKDIGVL